MFFNKIINKILDYDLSTCLRELPPGQHGKYFVSCFFTPRRCFDHNRKYIDPSNRTYYWNIYVLPPGVIEENANDNNVIENGPTCFDRVLIYSHDKHRPNKWHHKGPWQQELFDLIYKIRKKNKELTQKHEEEKRLKLEKTIKRDFRLLSQHWPDLKQ